MNGFQVARPRSPVTLPKRPLLTWQSFCVPVADIFANDFDLYRAWAEAVALGRTAPQPSRRYAAGMISLRPNRDGRVKGYEGLDEIQKRYGPSIVKAHLPPPGSPTQPIEAGYLANAWVWARHTDHDQLRAMMDDIGATIQVIAG